MTAKKDALEHEGEIEVEVRYSPDGSDEQGSKKWIDRDDAARLVREGRVVLVRETDLPPALPFVTAYPVEASAPK